MAAAVAALATVAAVAGGRPQVLVAVALAAPVVLAVVDRPQRGLLLLAALVPFDGLLLLVPVGGRVAGWKEALVLVVVAATFVAPAAARRAPGTPLPPWVAGAAAFTALGLVSAAIVGGEQGLLGAKIGFFYLLVAVAAWRCPLDAVERDRLVTVILVTAIVTAVYGVVQQVLGHVRLEALGYDYNTTIRFAGGYLRSFSTFVQPFPFGFFLMLALLVGLAHALHEPGRTRSTVFFLSAPILLAGLASSFVRGAWLGLAAGALYLAIVRHRALLLAVPPLLLSVAFLSPDASAAALSASSSEERVAGWRDNVVRVAEHPFGEGLGATGAAAERVADGLARTADVYQPDNYFVKTAIELGVVGLWLFVLVLVAAFGVARRAQRLPGRDGAFGAATAAFVLAAAVAATVSTFFEIFPLEVYFWLLLATVSGLAAPPAEAAP